ncbi:hypothetical protein ACF06X_33195 [Streptomyces sp. NPDC015346]|uniref:hypothetical protein n=1 Tax=Streptomyces sp. NPDC015346 TaxID=3364954 RepID=UPI0036F6F806
MADRELSPDEMRAVELLMQLQALSPDTATTVLRISLRMPDGSYIGDALLSANAVAALNDATLSLVAYREQQAPETAIDPFLLADLEEHCIGLDVDGLMAIAAIDPKHAVAAFDEITEDGEL